MYALAAEARREFEAILQEAGLWAVYTRTDPRFVCRDCYDLDTRSARPDCGTCFGTGRKTRLEPWLVYWSNSLRRPSEVDPPLSRMGITPQNTPVVFSRAQDRPVVGDRVFIVEWDAPWEEIPRGARPARLVQALQVTFVDPYLIREVIYYAAHCNYVTESLDAYAGALAGVALDPARS